METGQLKVKLGKAGKFVCSDCCRYVSVKYTLILIKLSQLCQNVEKSRGFIKSINVPQLSPVSCFRLQRTTPP